MSVKEQVLSANQRLPDDCTLRDGSEEIALLTALGEVEQDIQHGRVVNQEMKGPFGHWAR